MPNFGGAIVTNLVKQNLRRLRQQQRLSQRQLARMIDVNPGMISHWENGYCKPGPLTVPKLIQALKCDEGLFVNGGIDKTPEVDTEDDVKRVVDSFPKTPPPPQHPADYLALKAEEMLERADEFQVEIDRYMEMVAELERQKLEIDLHVEKVLGAIESLEAWEHPGDSCQTNENSYRRTIVTQV